MKPCHDMSWRHVMTPPWHKVVSWCRRVMTCHDVMLWRRRDIKSCQDADVTWRCVMTPIHDTVSKPCHWQYSIWRYIHWLYSIHPLTIQSILVQSLTIQSLMIQSLTIQSLTIQSLTIQSLTIQSLTCHFIHIHSNFVVKDLYFLVFANRFAKSKGDWDVCR